MTRPKYYVLDGHTPRAVSLHDWGMWFINHDEVRRVSFTDVSSEVSVSTVFLGIDHNFFGEGPPLLFETMVFGGEHDGEEWRTSTWEEAESTHRRAVARCTELRIVSNGD